MFEGNSQHLIFDHTYVNLLLGSEHMDGNDVVTSRTGKILNEFVSRYNLSIANSLVSDPKPIKIFALENVER